MFGGSLVRGSACLEILGMIKFGNLCSRPTEFLLLGHTQSVISSFLTGVSLLDNFTYLLTDQ